MRKTSSVRVGLMVGTVMAGGLGAMPAASQGLGDLVGVAMVTGTC
ncbi:hypothetical protein [Ensifer sp. MJa1]